MILFYLLITAMPLTYHPLFAGLVGNLTVVKYLGALCFAYAVTRIFLDQRLPGALAAPQSRWLLIHGMTVVVSNIASTAPDLHHEGRYNPNLSYFSFLLLLVTVVVLVSSMQRLRWAMLTAVGSIAFASLYVLREWQIYRHVYANFRPGWVVGDPNYYTISALLIIPVAYYGMSTSRSQWERLFCLASLGLTVGGMIVAASRGGLIALGVASTMIAWRSKHRLATFLLCILVLIPINLIAPASSLQRLLSPSEGDKSSTGHRLRLWQAGLRMILDRPVTGVGLGNYKLVIDRYSHEHGTRFVAHNTYVEIAAELGVIGLLSFLAIVGSSYQILEQLRWLARKNRSPDIEGLALALQTSLVSFLVGALFVSAHYQKLFWMVIFVTMTLPYVHGLSGQGSFREQQDQPDPSPMPALRPATL